MALLRCAGQHVAGPGCTCLLSQLGRFSFPGTHRLHQRGVSVVLVAADLVQGPLEHAPMALDGPLRVLSE